MKFRKLTGTHVRKENGVTKIYGPGSVMEATEEELRKHDLKTWERVADDLKTTGSADGVRTIEEYAYILQKESWVLNPDRGAYTHPPLEMVGLSAEDLLWQRETLDTNKLGYPVGGLALAKLALKEARDRWEYANSVCPVHERKAKPYGEYLQAINKAEAVVKVVQMEIDHLKKLTQTTREAKAAEQARIKECKKQQAQTFANHPHYRAMQKGAPKTGKKLTRRTITA